MDLRKKDVERAKGSKRKLEENEGKHEHESGVVKKKLENQASVNEEAAVMERKLDEDAREDNQVVDVLKMLERDKKEGDEQVEVMAMKYQENVEESEQVIKELKRKLEENVRKLEEVVENEELMAIKLKEKMEEHEQILEDLTRKFEKREGENEQIVEFLTDQLKEYELLAEMSRKKLEERGSECEQEKKVLQTKFDSANSKIVLQNQLLTKQELLLQQLKDKIECPVCMNIPRTGPLPVCPNGHFVCSKCKTGSCPTCRTDMGTGKSLLAVTVLENIEHRCKFDDCDEYFPLEDIKEHEQLCPRRTVHCPAPECIQQIPLKKLLDHLKASDCCSENNAPCEIISDWNCYSYSATPDEHLSLRDMCWPVHVYQFSGKNLVVFTMKAEGQYYFVPVLDVSETECLQYKIEMIVHERGVKAWDSELSAKFQGNPLSIDDKKDDHKLYGTNEQLINRLVKKSINKNSFSLSFKLSIKNCA